MKKNNKKQSRGSMIFDLLFEIVLILVILFGALLATKNDVVAGPDGYSVEPVSLIVTFGLLIFFIAFVVGMSVKKQKQDLELEKTEKLEEKKEEA